MPSPLPRKAKLKPLDDWIVCKMYQMRGMVPASEGGTIVIPDIAREETYFAHVVLVGPGRLLPYLDDEGNPQRGPMTVQPGTDITFKAFQGNRYKIGTEIWVTLRADDVIAELDLSECKDGEFGKFYEWCEEGSSTDRRLLEGQLIPGLNDPKAFDLQV